MQHPQETSRWPRLNRERPYPPGLWSVADALSKRRQKLARCHCRQARHVPRVYAVQPCWVTSIIQEQIEPSRQASKFDLNRCAARSSRRQNCKVDAWEFTKKARLEAQLQPSCDGVAFISIAIGTSICAMDRPIVGYRPFGPNPESCHIFRERKI